MSKGTLSGWPGLAPPDPQVVGATQDLYDVAHLELLQRAHIDWIWVTWSVGFSDQTEATQQAQLRRFIQACHQRGIHVTAYLSIGNLFWEDMFRFVPESQQWVLRSNGQPVPYGTADYGAVGHVTRYLADLSVPAWQEYTVARVLAAVDAGADGVMFDNNSALYDRSLLANFTARVLAQARQRNPEVLVSSNYGRAMALLARSENSITSEQGTEPGVFPSAGPPPDRWNAAADLLPVTSGFLAMNVGLLRTLWAVSEGARPVSVEYGSRHVGDRFLNLMRARHQKLALAECAAFHATNEQYHESYTLRDLFSGDAAAADNWAAVSSYNAFLQQRADLYREPRSAAGIAVVVDAQVTDLAFLNTLAASNVIYDVIFEQDATAQRLAAYRLVVAAPAVSLRAGWRRYPELSSADIAAASPGTVTAPDSVIANIHGQARGRRLLVHLLNYADAPVFGIEITLRTAMARAQLLSPDLPPLTLPVEVQSGLSHVRVPELQTYDVVVLEPVGVE
ncbi:MAG: hypothetical protein JOZ03_03955 [Gammaproteobacteria bacterium]|nr:hypothetical protein [Gammaproteobacteria bacterium]